MKRSEMLKKIEDLIDDNQDCYWNNSLARELLEFIEKEGMIPPRFSFVQDINLDTKTITISETRNEWEPEDEVKCGAV
jgi:hypothetical protein